MLWVGLGIDLWIFWFIATTQSPCIFYLELKTNICVTPWAGVIMDYKNRGRTQPGPLYIAGVNLISIETGCKRTGIFFNKLANVPGLERSDREGH
jgi:hypothetical protein